MDERRDVQYVLGLSGVIRANTPSNSNPMNFRGALVALVLASVAFATPLAAQTPAVAPMMERLEELMAIAKQAMNPAAIALGQREALALTAEQVAALENLSVSLQPTIDAAMSLERSSAPDVSALTSGPTVDREAIRAAYVARAEKQADVVATIAEAGKQMEGILTAEQRASMEVLQREAMLEMMRSIGFGITP